MDLEAIGEPFLGLSLVVYWDGADPSHWTPPPLAITERAARWAIAHDEVASLWMYPEEGAIDLPGPDGYGDPALRAPGQALLDLIAADDAYALVDLYFEALCGALHAALGVPVAYERTDGSGMMGPPLVRAQLGPEAAADWEVRGWLPPAGGARRAADPSLDVVLSVELADGRTAGIWRAAGGSRFLTSDVASRGGTGVDGGRVVVIGDDRVMVAGGVLPAGAVAARVLDLFDAWHDALVAGDLWLCALPHGQRGPTPPVAFRDAAGAEVRPPEEVVADDGGSWTSFSVALPDDGEELSPERLAEWAAEAAARDAALVRGARTPVYWDAALGAAPEVGAYDDETAPTSLELTGVGVVISTTSDHYADAHDAETATRDLLERRLWRPDADLRAVARAVLGARPEALEATIAGRAQTFLVLRGGGAWAARWVDPRKRVLVEASGDGAPPARLDLRDWRAEP